jgi:hypothetical protein
MRSRNEERYNSSGRSDTGWGEDTYLVCFWLKKKKKI